MDLAVWANSRTSPIDTCEDAKLSAGPTLLYPAGTNQGQAGWDVGLGYQDSGDLGQKLGAVKLSKGTITRLAINSHGAPGFFDLDGSGALLMTQNDRFLTVTTMGNKFNSQLAMIKMQLASDGIVLFMGCNLGQGEQGSEFLRTLSQTLFRGLLVVAFTTVGVSMQQYRAGQHCTNPGMRDTPFERPATTPELENVRYQGGVLFQLPWASESSPHAKTAKNGVILKNPDPPQTFDWSYIVGKWDVEIGPWKGVFVFEKTGAMQGSVYWMDTASLTKHGGYWSARDGAISWQFSDDPPRFKRTFNVVLPLQSLVNGSVQPSGFFKMLKQWDS